VLIVAVLGRGVVAPDTPILPVTDLGVLRGDGVFETMHVRGGEPFLLPEHLDRMARSAAALGLRAPARAELEGLAVTALAAWPAEVEASLRIVCTRGAEHGDGTPTVFATVQPVAESYRTRRREGVTVATAALGYAVGARTPEQTPWLLGGAKTLSYAVNMATMRWGAERGVDEVLWVSSDGYALEGPTASLIWLDGTELGTVPPARTGILPGISARWLLDHAGEFGWRGVERLVRPDELRGMDGVWFTSSVRGLVAVRSLDDVPLHVSPRTGDILARMGYPITSR
jgi:4-amino-4-deoxychorismate lyase